MATVRLAPPEKPAAASEKPAAVVEQPPPATPATPPTPPTITVDSPLLAPIPAAPKILTTWQEAVQLIDSRSTDLRIAEEEVAKAAGASRMALGRILPTVNASATFQHSPDQSDQPPGTTIANFTAPLGFIQQNRGDTTLGSIALSVPILRPRDWYAYGTARESVEMAKLSVVDRRRVLITNVASAIVSVFTAERVSEINRVGLKTSLERLELTRRRTRLGSGTRLDVVRAEQDVTLATNTIIQGDEALRKAREALGIAMGEDDREQCSHDVQGGQTRGSSRYSRSAAAVGHQ
jgi:outer membrane protein TolC